MNFIQRAIEKGTHFQPSALQVKLSSGIAAAAVITVAATSVVAARTDVTVEVDGVSIPVTTWQATAGGALRAAGLAVGEHDKVQPALTESIKDGDTVVMRTAHPYSIEVDGTLRTIWTTAKSADLILAHASDLGDTATLAADRSATRQEAIALVATDRTIVADIAGEIKEIQASAGKDAREVLAAAGFAAGPLDKVTVHSTSAGLTIDVDKVVRGNEVRKEDIPFETKETESGEYFKGERVMTTAGKVGVLERTVWREAVNGQDVHVNELSIHRAVEPVTEEIALGTKEVTPEALIEAGLDPKAQLEEVVEDGRTSMRYKSKLGSISSSAEIKNLLGNSASNEALAAAMAAGVDISYTGGDPKAIAHSMVRARGWNDSQFQCLVTLWNRESGWNPYADNPTSSAYGIPQALPGHKMASAGADWRTNPATQIEWGLGYIAGRYGTPCAALASSYSRGWY